jgi:hypothetical protein
MAGQYRFKDSNGNIVAQISASVGGVISFSGSQVDFSQANNVILGNVQLAGTASNALLLDGFDSQAFAFTSSIHPFTSSTNSRLNSIETISASNISRINSLETTSASVDTLNTTQNSRLDSLAAKTGSLASTGSNTFIGTQTITGSLYISSDLIVQGSSSLQNITASAVSIGTNIVNLNTANPAIRYAGLVIGDSGSIGSSGSFLYDSVEDEMLFIHRGANTTVTSSVVLMGPQTYDNVGNELYLTSNRIPKGGGNEHLIDSNITDIGSSIGIGITNPTYPLTRNGMTFKASGTDGAEFVMLSSTDTGFLGAALVRNGADFGVVNRTNGNLIFATNALERMYITSGGNVGIGITNPSQALSVSGSISLGNLSAALNFTGGGNARFLEIGSAGDALLVTHASGFGVGYFGYQSADDRLVIACDNGAGNNKIDFIVNATSTTGGGTNNLSGISPAMRIQANGNISIGGVGAGSKLTVYEGDIRLYKNHIENNTATWTSNILFTDEVDRLGARIVGERTAWDGAPMGLGFDTGGVGSVTRRMTITSAGSVGMGITNPSRMLQVKSNSEGQTAGISGATYGIRFDNGGVNSPNMSTIHGVDASLAGSYQPIMLNGLDVRVGTSDTERIRIASNGNVGIGTTNAGGKLTISRATEAQDYQLQLRVVGGIADGNYDGITFTQGAAGATPLGSIRMKYASSGYPGFGIYTRSASAAETERLSISNAGYINKPFQPAFKAGRSSSITVGNNSTIVFNDTGGNHFNIGEHYSTSTGMFTAPIAGRYVFSAVVIYQSLSNGQAMDDCFYIYKNSTLVAYSFRRAEYEAGFTGNNGYYVDHANTLLDLAAGDTVSIRNGRQLEVHGNTNYCFFYGYMLG